MAKEKKYRLSEKQVSTSLSGESVILNHAKGEYFSLNEVGTFIWRLMNNSGISKNELQKQVLENYDVSINDCKNDIDKLLIALTNEGLLEEV